MLAIIQEILERINTRITNSTMYIIIFVLSMFIGFFSGRMYSYSNIYPAAKLVIQNPQNSIQNMNNYADLIIPTALEGASSTAKAAAGRIYASSKGKRYYIEGVCDGNISPKNKVYYKTIAAATAAGKTRAAGCK